MIRVGLHGATGRLGRLVREEVEAAPDLVVAWACGRDLPADLDADVIIDTSTPDGLRRLAGATRVPIVSGTTGVDVEGHTLLHAPNFALGVAVLADLVARARRALPDWQVEVVELHHSMKRDAPSGTALRLVPGPVVRRHDGLRDPAAVGVHSVRGGDVVGEHTVYLFGAGERVELRHVAHDRRVFAVGAVRCARWLVGKPPGRYRIEDLLADQASDTSPSKS